MIPNRKDLFITQTYNKTVEDAIEFLHDIENDTYRDNMLYHGLIGACLYGNVEVFNVLFYHPTNKIRNNVDIYDHLLGRNDEHYKIFNALKHVNYTGRKIIIRLLLNNPDMIAMVEYREMLKEHLGKFNIIRLCCE